MIIVIIIICLTTWWVNKNKNTPLIDGQKLHTNSPGSKERKPNLKFRNGTHERKSILATFMIFFFFVGGNFHNLQPWSTVVKLEAKEKVKLEAKEKEKEEEEGSGKVGLKVSMADIGGRVFSGSSICFY